MQQTAFSLDDLREAKWALVEMMGTSGIEGVGIDTRANGFVVVSSDTSATAEAIVRVDVGRPVVIRVGSNVDGTCADRLNCGGTSARRGGVSLNRSGVTCTSGLTVIRSGTRYSTTAGHCWYGVTSGTVTSGTQTFGSLNSVNALVTNTFCDCRLVSTGGASTPNRVYFSNASPYVAITSKRTYSAVGDSVRLLGRNTQSSGTVAYVEYTYSSGTCSCTVNGGTLASYSQVSGDSGGAITSTGGSVGVGLHSGGSAGYGRYFEVVNIQNWLSATVATS